MSVLSVLVGFAVAEDLKLLCSILAFGLPAKASYHVWVKGFAKIRQR